MGRFVMRVCISAALDKPAPKTTGCQTPSKTHGVKSRGEASPETQLRNRLPKEPGMYSKLSHNTVGGSLLHPSGTASCAKPIAQHLYIIKE